MSLFLKKKTSPSKAQPPSKLKQIESERQKEKREWASDHKQKNCEICHQSFNLLTRSKHHCRACKRAVCGHCSTNRWFIERFETEERVCDTCFDELSNKHPINSTVLPQYQVLTDAGLFSWLATFEKAWLRSRNPRKYNKYKKQLLQVQTPSSSTLINLKAHTHPLADASSQKTAESVTQTQRRNPLVVIQTGLLYVNIMEAIGLPDCDRFSEPDGYCVFYVTNNDVCFGQTTKYSTKVQHNTYEPQWNADETLIVTNTTGKLVIELWDYDLMDKDDFLGTLEIPIQDLFLHFSVSDTTHSHPKVLDEWFEIELAEQWRLQKSKQAERLDRRARKQSKSQRSGSETVFDNPHCATLMRHKYDSTTRLLQIPVADDDADDERLKPVYKRIPTMPRSYRVDMSEPEIRSKCFIHLQLKMVADPWGNFISFFDPLLPPPPKPTVFNIDVFYAELNKLLACVWPVVATSKAQVNVVLWRDYGWSFVYLIMYAYCVFHPWFAVFCLHFRVLVWCCHSYVVQTVLTQDGIGRRKEICLPTALHVLCVMLGILPYVFRSVSNKKQQLIDEERIAFPERYEHSSDSDDDGEHGGDGGGGGDEQDGHVRSRSSSDRVVAKDKREETKETEDEDDMSMGAFTRVIGNKVVRVSGLKDNLGWYQELLVFVNETVDFLGKLFNWTFPSITTSIVITLMSICLLSVFLRKTSFYQYELLLLGGGILAYYSKPVQFLLWLYFGFSRWYFLYHRKYVQFKHEVGEFKGATAFDIGAEFDEADLYDEMEEFEDEDEGDDTDKQQEGDTDTQTETKSATYRVIYCWHLIKHKLWRLVQISLDLALGLYELLKPIFTTTTSTTQRDVQPPPLLSRSEVFPARSQSEPATTNLKSAVYSDAVQQSTTQPHTKSPQFLRRRTPDASANKQGGSSGNKFSLFKKPFGRNDSDDDGYVQQKKKQQKQSIKTTPTLCRQRTLKKIDSAANDKINAMMAKLESAKSIRM